MCDTPFPGCICGAEIWSSLPGLITPLAQGSWSSTHHGGADEIGPIEWDLGNNLSQGRFVTAVIRLKRDQIVGYSILTFPIPTYLPVPPCPSRTRTVSSVSGAWFNSAIPQTSYASCIKYPRLKLHSSDDLPFATAFSVMSYSFYCTA